MIDLHCHILPNVDDGAKSIDESIEMAKIAERDGITKIVATPHFNDYYYSLNREEIKNKISYLQKVFEERGIKIELFIGAEYYLNPSMSLRISEEVLITVNNNERYCLIEFPFRDLPSYVENFILQIMISGITPVLMHPERNEVIIKKPERLETFVKKGVIVAINGGSLLGEHGSGSRKTAEKLLKMGLVHILASDAHSVDSRPPKLSGAFRKAKEIIGEDKALKMVKCFPETIIKGDNFEL